MSSGGLAPAAASAEEHAQESRSLREVPDRKRKTAIGSEHAGKLRGRALRAAQVQHDEVPHRRIERFVGDGECLGVAGAEVQLRMQTTSERDHRLGDVDPTTNAPRWAASAAT
ncbi:MAG TPA: hypothetical protein VHF45_09505 [Thermoleophilaceae bacterium]|nr:hypothetical protein [Thermoleophilaceae bacterium]